MVDYIEIVVSEGTRIVSIYCGVCGSWVSLELKGNHLTVSCKECSRRADQTRGTSSKPSDRRPNT